jgi:hypothetical protein
VAAGAPPRKGAGSAGAHELYGWDWVGALAAPKGRIGSCERHDTDAAAFSAKLASIE